MLVFLSAVMLAILSAIMLVILSAIMPVILSAAKNLTYNSMFHVKHPIYLTIHVFHNQNVSRET